MENRLKNHLPKRDDPLYLSTYYQHNKTKIQRQVRQRKRQDPLKFMLWSAHERAKRNGLKFSITKSDVQMPERCPILGVKLTPGTKKYKEWAPSLDRIDSAKGYIPGNVRVISYRANRIKNDSTPYEILLLAKDAKRIIRKAA